MRSRNWLQALVLWVISNNTLIPPQFLLRSSLKAISPPKRHFSFSFNIIMLHHKNWSFLSNLKLLIEEKCQQLCTKSFWKFTCFTLSCHTKCIKTSQLITYQLVDIYESNPEDLHFHIIPHSVLSAMWFIFLPVSSSLRYLCIFSQLAYFY